MGGGGGGEFINPYSALIGPTVNGRLLLALSLSGQYNQKEPFNGCRPLLLVEEMHADDQFRALLGKITWLAGVRAR